MSVKSPSVVRERILDKLREVGGGEGDTATPTDVVGVVEPLKLFLDDEEDDAKEDAVMYSDTFEGAKKYLEETGKPDIDITKLMLDRDWETT